MVHNNERAKDLEAVSEALTDWRRRHGGRGRPIPASLWSGAAEVARTNGVAETARALHVDPRRARHGAWSSPRGSWSSSGSGWGSGASRARRCSSS
jgi:hypothetical protein